MDVISIIIGVVLMILAGLVKSKSDARKLIQQKGVSLGGEPVGSHEDRVTRAQLEEGAIVRKGKKVFRKFLLA